MRNRDPLGYYSALNLSPTASTVEVRLSYRFLKQAYQQERRNLDISKIRSAYRTLTDPAARQRYDRGEIRAAHLKELMGRPGASRKVLIALLAVSLLVLLWLVVPSLMATVRSFGPGDEIFWDVSGETVGVVMGYEERHAFPSGVVVPAYEVRPASGETPVWYPARDLKRHARTR